jgi:hypothetical protein
MSDLDPELSLPVATTVSAEVGREEHGHAPAKELPL